jgi:hypothetical protein
MRYVLIVSWMLFCSVTSAMAQVNIGIGIGLPGVSIGINLPLFPELVRVPGYPVYYAPRLNSNFFFYDGMYWVYQRDNWYASSWYNGPWWLVSPEAVPYFILRIPVRYYRRPPTYFHGWTSNAPPRWGEHWGNTWAQSRQGWDNWDRRSVPAPAPLPTYQRQYSGNKYPRAEQQQQALRSQNYRYQPHEAVVQQHYQAQQVQSPSAVAPNVTPGAPPATKAQQQQAATQQKAQQQKQQEAGSQQKAQQQQQQAATQQKAQQQKQQEAASQQKAQQQQQQAATQQKAQQQKQQEAASQQKAQQQQQQAATQQKAQQQKQQESANQQKAQQQQAAPREQQTPRSNQENVPQGKGASQEPKRGQEQEKDRQKGE